MFIHNLVFIKILKICVMKIYETCLDLLGFTAVSFSNFICGRGELWCELRFGNAFHFFVIRVEKYSP